MRLGWHTPDTPIDKSVASTKYLESVSWSVIMIVISNLVMSVVEREPGGFRIL